MQEDNRSVKELIMAILEKCKEALPELALLNKKIEELKNNPQKIKKKDCLNPTFLVRLSESGEKIRLVLTHALTLQFAGKDTLNKLYQDYMQVIYDIRKYHEQAHKGHDLHKNSTQMKNNLLNELKQQTERREQLENRLQILIQEHQKNINEKDSRIQELEEILGEKDVNLSHISHISKKVEAVHGQFYGGTDKVGSIEEDYEYTVETCRLRKRILELEEQIEEKQHQHLKELDNQRMEILQLESKFQELIKSSSFSSQNLKLDTLDHLKRNSLQQYQCQHEDLFRLLTIQATTIEQLLTEQQDN